MPKMNERLNEYLTNLQREILGSYQSKSIPFINVSAILYFITIKEIEDLIDPPLAVFHIDSIEELNPKDFVLLDGTLPAKAEIYFSAKPRYTARREYYIVGSNLDAVERTFKYLAKDEAYSGSLITINATLEGAQNHLIINPWGAQIMTTVTSDLQAEQISRESPNDPWVKSAI